MENKSVALETSEATLVSTLHKFTDAGASVVQVRTREVIRAAVALRHHLIAADIPYAEWDAVNGFRTFTRENFTDHKVSGDMQMWGDAISRPLAELRNPASAVNATQEKVHYFVYLDPQLYMTPIDSAIVQQYAALLPSTNVCIILLTPETPLPDIPAGTLLVTDLRTPTQPELVDSLTRLINSATNPDDADSFKEGSDLDDDDVDRVASLGKGMSLYEFETHAALSIIEAMIAGDDTLTVDHFLDGIAKGKTEVVKQSEILELIPSGSIEDVGGMQRLKDWIDERAGCYSDAAADFGIDPPKGCALVGVPGTGKSLVAKAVSAVLEVPLVRLDFGRVFSKYVGDSESRVRSALRMVEDMAPCVLFVDEIDKGLGGAGGGGGDGGVSSRVLGSFLTWLQEYKSPIFTMVTANRVDGLPPELLRRGRFDAIFSVAMPSPEERKAVFAIHLRKRGRDIKEFSAKDLEQFVADSNGYVPAEIESAVKDALISAFHKDEELSMSHVSAAFKVMVPMSRSHKERIDAIIAWAKDNATPVNYDAPAKTNADAFATAGGRRVLRSPGRAS